MNTIYTEDTKKELVNLLLQYHQLLEQHLEITNDTIQYSATVKKLLVLLEKCEIDLGDSLPAGEPKLKDAIRQTQNLLTKYFATKRSTLIKQIYNMDETFLNSLTNIRMLHHTIRQTVVALESETEQEQLPIRNLFNRVNELQNRTVFDFQKIKHGINAMTEFIEQLTKELSIPDVPLKEPVISLEHLLKKISQGHVLDLSHEQRQALEEHFRTITHYLAQHNEHHAQSQFDAMHSLFEELKTHIIHEFTQVRAIEEPLKQKLQQLREEEHRFKKEMLEKEEMRQYVFGLSTNPFYQQHVLKKD